MMLNKTQLEVVEYYKEKEFSFETVTVINQYFGIVLNSREDFSEFISNIFIPGQYIDVIVDDKEESKVPKWRVYEMLNTYFKHLTKVTEEFIVHDMYCDMVKIYKDKDNAIYVKFYTWSCGTPESYTYDIFGNCKRQYNAEYDCCGDYDYGDEEDAEEEVKAEIVVSNKIIDVDFKEEDIIEEEIIDEETATEENQEDEEMNNNETTAQDIWKKMESNAKEAINFGLSGVTEIKKLAKMLSAMSPEQAESYCRKQFGMSCKAFFEYIKEKLNIELEYSKQGDAIFNDGEDSEGTSAIKRALDNINTAIHTGEKHGWAKAKDILKALFGFAFALFIEIAKVVLKLAFTIAVGVVKIGATMVNTVFDCAGIVTNDIIKPTVSGAKKANTERKARKAAKHVGIGVI